MMNMVVDIKNFNKNEITFLDMKKNNIIDGNFSDIIYDNSNVTINGIFIGFHIIPHHIITYNDSSSYGLFYFDINQEYNINIISDLIAIEYSIIEYYKNLYKINKTSIYQLKTQLQSGTIKIYKKEHYQPISKSNSLDNKYELSKLPNTIHHFYTNSYIYGKDEIKEGEIINRKKNKNYLLKISGIWENKISIGITYKITELYEQI